MKKLFLTFCLAATLTCPGASADESDSRYWFLLRCEGTATDASNDRLDFSLTKYLDQDFAEFYYDYRQNNGLGNVVQNTIEMSYRSTTLDEELGRKKYTFKAKNFMSLVLVKDPEDGNFYGEGAFGRGLSTTYAFACTRKITEVRR